MMADVNFLMPSMNNNTPIPPRTEFASLLKHIAVWSSNIFTLFFFALSFLRDTNLQFLVLEFNFFLFCLTNGL